MSYQAKMSIASRIIRSYKSKYYQTKSDYQERVDELVTKGVDKDSASRRAHREVEDYLEKRKPGWKKDGKGRPPKDKGNKKNR